MKRNPFGSGDSEGKDGSHSLSFPLVEDRWWVQYTYPDIASTDPVMVRVAHLCPKEADGTYYINPIPMEDITGPGITYTKGIVCNFCSDSGALHSGRWVPTGPGLPASVLTGETAVVKESDGNWEWYHSFFSDGHGATKHASRGSAEREARYIGGYVFRARPLELIPTEPHEKVGP